MSANQNSKYLGESANGRIREGRPHPLGASWDGLGVNFALFSANATKVELCLLTRRESGSSNASRCPNTPTRSGTGTSPMHVPAPYTGIAFMGLTSQRPVIGLIPTSSFWILTPSR